MAQDLIEFKNYFSENQPSDSVMLAMKFTTGMNAKPVAVHVWDESFEPEEGFQYYFTPNFIDPAILEQRKLSQGTKKDVKYVSGITVDMDFGKTGHKKPSNFNNEIEVMEMLNA